MVELVAFAGLPLALSRLCLRDGRQRKDIAEAAGINASMFSGYLSGRRMPSLEHLDRILTVMGFTVEELAYEIRAAGQPLPKAPLVVWPKFLHRQEGEAAAAILTTLLESMQTMMQEQERERAKRESRPGPPPANRDALPKMAIKPKKRRKKAED